MANDLSSAVAERIAQERGEDVAPAQKPTATKPDDASKDTAAAPEEHQTEAAVTEQPEAEKPKGPRPEDLQNLTPEQVDELLRSNKTAQQRLYRAAQAMKDKELARIQRQQEEQRQAEEARRKLEEMDDEDYGRHVREEQRTDELVRQRAINAMVPVFQAVQGKALSKLSDAQIRHEIEARITTGELGDLDTILETILETETKARVEKASAKLEAKLRKEIREALEKERAAEIADEDTPPILGSGTPTGSRELHGMELLAAGVADARREARKRK